MKATVYYRRDAKPGDLLWVWDADRRVHDSKGKYVGAGVFLLRPVTAINRMTVTVDGHGGFDIKTGVGRRSRGYGSSGSAHGEIEFALHWYWLDRFPIARLVERATAEQIKRVAEIFGHTPEEPPILGEDGPFGQSRVMNR